MATNTIKVILTGDAKGMVSSLETASSKISQFGAAATLALGALTVKSVMAASNLEQSQGAVESVFKRNAEVVQQWAADAADNLGLSESAYSQMAATIGSQLRNLGISEADLATQTNDLIVLAGDLAATFGGTTSEAVQALSALLRGERDPIERYGVSIKEADIAARMAADGTADLSGEQEKQAKIQATLALLNEQTAAAQGQYARESGSTAQRIQELRASFENLTADIGEGLLPAAESVLRVGQGLMNLFAKLPGPVKSAVVVTGLLGAAVAAVGPKIIALRANLAAAGVTMATFRAAALRTVLATGAVGVALTAVAWIIGSVIARNQEAKAATDSYTDSLNENTGAITKNTRATVAQRLEDEGVLEGLEERGLATDEATQAVLRGVDATQAYIDAHADELKMATRFGLVNNDLANSLLDEAGALEESRASWERKTEAEKGSAKATDNATDSTDDLVSKLEKVNKELETYRKRWEAVIGVQMDVDEASDAGIQAIKDLRAALKESERGFRGNSQAALDARESLRAAAEAAIDIYDANRKAGSSHRAAASAAREHMERVYDAARAMGVSKSELMKLFPWLQNINREWRKVPSTVSTTYYVNRIGVGGRDGKDDKAMAYGGYISGPGGPRDDMVPAWLSNGEYVIQAAAVKRLGVGFLDALNRGRIRGFAQGGSANRWAGLSDKQVENIRTYNKAVLDALKELVQKAKDQVSELRGQRRDLAQSISKSVSSGLSLGSMIQDRRDNDARSVLARYRQQARKMRRFIGQLNRLWKAGLSRALLNEVMEMGSEEGSVLAGVLLSQPRLIKQFNRVSGGLDRTADRFGRRMGHRYFDDRIDRAERELARAERRMRSARDDRRDFGVINIHVAGSVLTDRELAKAITPIIREEWRKRDRRNGKRG